MKRYILLFVFCIISTSLVAQDLTEERQLELIKDYMYATGQLSQSQASSYMEDNELTDISNKCGMSIVKQFKNYYNKFDKNLLKSTGVQLAGRVDFLTDSVASPSGKFLVHYTTTGENAVYSNVPGGAAGYVDSVARILDDVYNHTVNILGYPAPIIDSFYAEGGDEKYDVYLLHLAYYGLAYPDSVLFNFDSTEITATSFLELENDYAELSQYRDRPLDAVRVTAAHEFFHMVQFGIDASESEEVSNVVDGPAWMEMSAVWMEEEIYDDINDYYNYLPFFFDKPWASIQQYTGPDLHPYASVVYPLFLSEKFDRDIIHSIWTKCGEYGAGPHFLQVVEEVVDSASGGSESFESVFSEFALWNYFTGSRARLAPDGVGYSERNNYEPEFSEDIHTGDIIVDFYYPKVLAANDNDLSPIHNGAFYLKLLNVDKNKDQYVCIDSTVTFDTSFVLTDTIVDTTVVCLDSTTFMDMYLFLDPGFNLFWGTNVIYTYKDYIDSLSIEEYIFPGQSVIHLELKEPKKYKSIAFTFTPASSNRQLYLPNNPVNIGYAINDSTFIDSLNANAPSSIFFPYPNPAVVEDMADNNVNFKFQYFTDSLGFQINLFDSLAAPPYMIVDIFNINGEYIRTLEDVSEAKSDYFSGQIVTEWDMKNESGEDVASGVYLAYARLFENDIKGELLAEKKTKIAVIR